MADLSKLSEMIRWPFLMVGKILSFILEHLIILALWFAVMWALWHWRYTLFDILAEYHKRKKEKKEVGNNV